MADPTSDMEHRLLVLITQRPGLNAEEMAETLGVALDHVRNGLCLLVASERVETLGGIRPRVVHTRARFRLAGSAAQADGAERRLAPNLDLRRLVMAGNLMALQLERMADALDATEGADPERPERTLAAAWEGSLARLRSSGVR